MSCSIDVALIALQLARGLVADPTAVHTKILVFDVELEARARAADYKEFQRLAETCSQRVAGTGTVTSLKPNRYSKELTDALKPKGIGPTMSGTTESSSITIQAPDRSSFKIMGPIEFHDVENGKCPVWKDDRWASGDCPTK